jgi:redox-sensitive bicupin YhaK (pirin superfamily)
MSDVSRREAIKMLVAAGASTAAACAEPTAPKGPPKSAASEPPKPGAVEPPPAVTRLTKLGFQWPTSDPFLFCVHHDDRYPAANEAMGPEASLAGRNLGQDFELRDGWRMYHGQVVPGFPRHPHRGFETVTVVRRGLLDHSDSMGATARYGGGDVQWLTAGGGIQHAEMFPLIHRGKPNPLELFQIWLNLPGADKMTKPHFSMLWENTIPRLETQDDQGRQVAVTVMAGRLGSLRAPPPPPKSWASKAENHVAIWTIKLAPGARWTLPPVAAGVDRSLYYFQGSGLRVAGRSIPDGHRVELRREIEVALDAGPHETELLLLQGRPIGEPVAHQGPFVMNTRQELMQAYSDYRQTGFGGWPWRNDDPVHARTEGRFAQHADGRVDRPT